MLRILEQTSQELIRLPTRLRVSSQFCHDSIGYDSVEAKIARCLSQGFSSDIEKEVEEEV